MRIGVLASSGGSVFAEMVRILNQADCRNAYYVFTDRECGIESFCDTHAIPLFKCRETNNQAISLQAKQYFESVGGVDCVILYFLRLVTGELFKAFPSFNIHPSLLPAFRGFHPLKKAMKSGVRFVGATLHQVNESMDGGPIIAQTTAPLLPKYDERTVNKISFLQKVYLSLLLIELLNAKTLRIANGQTTVSDDAPYTNNCNPAIANPRVLSEFIRLQITEGVSILND